MKNIRVILFLIILSLTISSFGQALKVGEEINKIYETPHPYIKGENNVWSQTIKYEGATYISVHFSKFELAPGDFLLVRSSDNERSWKYTEKGNSKYNEGFWSIPIHGDELIIEVYKNSRDNYYGYTIDKFARGYTDKEINADIESLCGPDDSQNAKCYQTSNVVAYEKSKSVAKLLINGTNACTGWLIGDQGHIMTNNHCVGTSSSANNVSVEFMAEGANCATNCQSWFACPGTIVATSTNLVQTNANLDYSLLSLSTNVTSTYGFLQLRQAGATLNERIFIPQHPQGWGKRIAINSTHPSDSSDGFGHINSTTEPRCTGTGNDIGYFADTQGGSSGSPVLGYNDNLVVALHHCGNCPNRGVPIQEIIANLGANLPNNALGCIDHLNIATNVSSGNTDRRQALITINAQNTINNGAIGIYHAGNEVILSTGFVAAAGSKFRAYKEGCTSNFVGARLYPSNDLLEDNYDDIKSNSKHDEFIIIPNPNDGKFTILSTNINKGDLFISDLFGNIITKMSFNEVNNIEINIQDQPKGIYIIKIISNDIIYTSKLIKE